MLVLEGVIFKVVIWFKELVFQVAWIFSLIFFCKILEVSNVPEVRVYHLELREWRACLQG